MEQALVEKLLGRHPLLQDVQAGKEVCWINPSLGSHPQEYQTVTSEDMQEAQARLARFAPLIMACFPETKEAQGVIESPLTEIPGMQKRLQEKYGATGQGRVFLKEDNRLAIAGSVKARGGIYEVLQYAETVALKHGLLGPGESYARLAQPDCRHIFQQYTIQVGSTGNLGLSIGIISAALGFQVVVHMSADAKAWKKDLLRSKGVTVLEYETDYSQAVEEGRRLSHQDPQSYFVDDEHSKNLFLGYVAAAPGLAQQLQRQGLVVDKDHPLFVYLPCGVGGAPGGITFGLKQIFGEHAHCFFVEPTQAPCMLLGMVTGLHSEIGVQDIGLSGETAADGLAVGRPSGFVGKAMEPLLSGAMTVQDDGLYTYLRELMDTEGIFLEPSACAAFHGLVQIQRSPAFGQYIKNQGLSDKMDQAIHIPWATGGQLVPEALRQVYLTDKRTAF